MTGAGVEPDGAPRLLSLDVLRGVAILGILFMNVQDMGGPLAAAFVGDPRLLGWTRADQLAWWVREVVANGTARCLLEMLFGAGMAILTDRAATRFGGARVLRDYAWRNLVLFAFGLVHVFVLLWPGDILHTYGLAALIVVLFRHAKPRLMLTIGLTLAVVQLLGGSLAAAVVEHGAVLERRAAAGAVLTPADRQQFNAWREEQLDRARDHVKAERLMREEDRQRRGTGVQWARSSWTMFLYVQTRFAEIDALWEAAGTMLIGAALYRWGLLQGARGRRAVTAMMVAGYGLGLPLRWWAAAVTLSGAEEVSFAPAFAEVARLSTTLGHVGLLNLLLASAVGARLLKPFAAAGRTALTIYIAQTLICLWLLYPPWGLRLYGQGGWAALMATALAVDAVLLIGAVWWTRRFRIAPVEWAWRSTVARRRLPFRPHA